MAGLLHNSYGKDTLFVQKFRLGGGLLSLYTISILVIAVVFIKVIIDVFIIVCIIIIVVNHLLKSFVSNISIVIIIDHYHLQSC